MPFATYNFNLDELNQKEFAPFGMKHGWKHKINLEGLVLHPDGNRAYSQLWRKGFIEAVTGLPLNQKMECNSRELEQYIKEVSRFLIGMRNLEINFPICLFISLINVKGTPLIFGGDHNPSDVGIFDRQVINLPEFIIRDNDTPLDKYCVEILEQLANAAGYRYWMN